MGKISLNVTGGNSPYNVTAREISEATGNRCNGCSGLIDLNNLDVSFIQDGLPHTYVFTVSNGDCHDGVIYRAITCSCPNPPILNMNYVCNPDNTISLYATPAIAGNGQLRVVITQNGTVIYNQMVVSGNTIQLNGVNGATYQGYSELSSECRSNTVTTIIDCEVECTLNVTISNITC